MKRTLPLIALLALAGCSAQGPVGTWSGRGDAAKAPFSGRDGGPGSVFLYLGATVPTPTARATWTGSVGGSQEPTGFGAAID